MNDDPIFGVLAFLSFAASVVAAVLAIDMFAISRTGQFGPAWRVLIIASVMFALVQALRIASFFDWHALQRYGLSQIVELMFALSLAYAIYLQRHAFSARSELRQDKDELDAAVLPIDEDDENVADDIPDKQCLNLADNDADNVSVNAPRVWPRLK
jgi:hypothetical protein